MRRAGYAWVVAALATGCLEAPPSGQAPAGDGGVDADAGMPGALHFPPAGAEVNISAALAADIDEDGREDLVLLDDEVDDEWAGVYILLAGEGGWRAIDEVRLGFKPTAAWYGDDVVADGAALVVGGVAGRIAVVDREPDMPYKVDEFDFGDSITTPLTIVHTGVADEDDTGASLVMSDGATLWSTSPLKTGGPDELEVRGSGTFLDAGFWPRRGNEPALYIAARRVDRIVWFTDAGDDEEMISGAAASARFGQLVANMCATHLVRGSGDALSIGYITCEGDDAGDDPLEGSLIPSVLAMAAGDIGGGPADDVALVGVEDDALYGQVLLDLAYANDADPSFVPAAPSNRRPFAAAVPGTIHLTPVDVEGDGSALIYAAASSGAVFCGRIVGEALLACAPAWQVRER